MHSTAGTIEKVVKVAELNRYGKSMQRNVQTKSEFISSYLCKKQSGKTLDVGCCDGTLLRNLKNRFNEHHFTGVDISKGFIDKATRDNPDIVFLKLDVFRIDEFYPDNHFHNIVLSSVLHEIFSYSKNPYTKATLKFFFKKMYKILQNEGRIIILDPAKPINPNKLIKVVFDSSNGLNPEEDELSEVNVELLSTLAKFRRFIKDFKAFNQVKAFLLGDQNTYVMNNWLFSEFLRHRNLHETPSHWNSEMKEVYGSLTPNEIINLTLAIGFKVLSVQNYYNHDHFSSPKTGEFEIYDNTGRIDLSDIYLTHSRYVFEK